MCAYVNKGDLAACNWIEDFPIITCGTGAGKTDFVMRRKLAECIEQDTEKSIDFVLMLVPTQALRDDILSNDRYKATPLDESDLMQPIEDRENIRVACFAKIVEFLSSDNEIRNIPDLIVIDEIDALVTWSLYFKGYIEAWEWLLNSPAIKCGLTATPSLLLDYIKPDAGIRFADITPDYPIRYKAKQIEIIRHSSASTYLKSIIDSIDGDNKAIVYVRSASLCKTLAERYGDKAGYAISKSNEKYKDQMIECSDISFGAAKIPLRDYLLERKKLPPQMNLLFFNDCMNAGFNIEDESVKTVIVDSVDLAIAIQSKGRVRHDLDRFVLITNGKEKEPYFRNLDRARKFFDEKLNQVFLKSWYIQESQIEQVDILTYKCGKWYKVNPFARAIYEYMFDIFEHMDSKEYFEPLAAHSENDLSFVDADTISEKARNLSNFGKLDLSLLFGFESDEDREKFITSKELQAIAKQASIRNAKGNLLGKESFIQYVNEHSEFQIAPIGRKMIEGIRSSYYKIVRC